MGMSSVDVAVLWPKNYGQFDICYKPTSRLSQARAPFQQSRSRHPFFHCVQTDFIRPPSTRFRMLEPSDKVCAGVDSPC